MKKKFDKRRVPLWMRNLIRKEGLNWETINIEIRDVGWDYDDTGTEIVIRNAGKWVVYTFDDGKKHRIIDVRR